MPKTPHDSRTDSLHKRYFYKLLTNLVGLPVQLVMQAIIPRGLGPQAYGDFHFLTNFFSQVVNFLDMGTSLGFYTKLSQRPQETGLVSFYSYFMLISTITCLGLITITIKTPFFEVIWPNQKIAFIYLAAVWAILTWVIQVLQKMTDSYGLTVRSELTYMVQRIFGMIILVLLFWYSILNIISLFIFYYIIMALLIIGLFFLIQRSSFHLKSIGLTFSHIKNYLREYYSYSHPLFIYAIVSLVAGIFDRWLLQVFGGSIQQGFYGLAYQIGAVGSVFTTAMTPLLMREFAVAFKDNDLEKMSALFRRYIPLFYAIAAYFACFIMVQADYVVYLMGGQKFGGAVAALSLMALYPIHQTYGQLSGSVFWATGQTGLYRNIGVSFMVLGLPVTYFLIAPATALGLDAGATGLAIKTVVLQIFGVNVMLYYNAQGLKLRFWKYVGHQAGSLAGLLFLAFMVKAGVDAAWPLQGYLLLRFLLAGFVYTLLVMVVVIMQPSMLGLHRQDIAAVWEKGRGKFKL